MSAKQGKILNDNLASHIHGNIANDGKIGTSNNSNKNVVTDASGKITIEDKPTIPSIVDNLNSTSSTSVLSAKQGKILNDNKQDLLISGTNIKTINNQSLLGNGDISISGGSGGSVNIRTSSTGFSSTLTDTDVPSEKLIKEYVDNTIGSIQNFIHS